MSSEISDRPCLAEEITQWQRQDTPNVLPILLSAEDYVVTKTDDGMTHRMLICARCTALSSLTHDQDFNSVEVQDPAEIGGRCQPPASPAKASSLRYLSGLSMLGVPFPQAIW